jgi:hypothetical protein
MVNRIDWVTEPNPFFVLFICRQHFENGLQSVGPTLSRIKVLGGQIDTPGGVVTEKNFLKKSIDFLC